MRTRMSQTHDHFGGKLHLYKRDGTPYWQCSTYLANRNHRTTTKERDLDHAKKRAEEWYLSLQLKHRTGELKSGHLFRDAADKFLPEYEALMLGERSAKYIKGHGERLRVHILPFFGKMSVTEIGPQTAQDYRVHRMTSRTTKSGQVRRPSRSALHHEIVTVRHVLKTAQRLGWIKAVPDLSAPYKASGKVSHRAWLSNEEYKRLYNATRERAANPPKPRWKWECEQLHDFVLFMVNTGLRPDEAGRLEFRDVEIVEDRATNETILEISVRGKRGVGYCKSMPGAVIPFERLRKRKRLLIARERVSKGGNLSEDPRSLALPKPTDLVFPALRNHHLKAVLEELDLKKDREGLPRSAYSLRHTYICLRLMEGADIYQIAKNCRTSVEMIEKFYAAHIKDMIDTASVNVRKDRPDGRRGKRPADAKSAKTTRKFGYRKSRA